MTFLLFFVVVENEIPAAIERGIKYRLLFFSRWAAGNLAEDKLKFNGFSEDTIKAQVQRTAVFVAAALNNNKKLQRIVIFTMLQCVTPFKNL